MVLSIEVPRTWRGASGEFSLGANRPAPYHMGMAIIAYMMYIAGGFLFTGSLAAHVYTRIWLRPSEDSDLEDYYHEFEDEHPEYARYSQWLSVTMAGATLGVLLLFLGVVF